MKVELQRLNTANKPSPMSEGVTEIRINNQPYKGINLTTRHTRAQRAPRVATIHDEVKETIRAQLTLVHVFHTYASTDTAWVAHALSHFTPVRYGRIDSVSAAHDTTQFGDSICLVRVNRAQLMHALIDTDGGYHLGAPNITLDHSPSFLSSILHFLLLAPPGLILNHSIIYSSSQHSFHEPGYQKALNLVSAVCHSTSTRVLSTTHSMTNGFSTTIGSICYTKGIMHSRVSFNSYNINAQINNTEGQL
jgi:hypothetical protein